MATLEQLHQLVDELPEPERETAAYLLAALSHRPAVAGSVFFAGNGAPAALCPQVSPVAEIDELRGDFWPEDEGPDDFVSAVRAWRREGT